MSMRTDRRRFLRASAAGGALLGLGDLGFLSRLRPVSADEAALDPKVVRLQPEIEPLVRLLEETPRERLLEEVAARMRKGTGYREVLAALLLAGVRNVQPRPSVGFKFHAVLVVNSAHLASLASPDTDRWLPIFWALDYFKSSQAQDVREGNWTMAPVDESAVPPARKARAAFTEAMDNWDEAAADAAVAALARSAGANAGLRAVLPLRRPRLPLDRPQGDLRRQQLPHAAVHRLAARRAGPAVAGLRPADARGRQPRRARRRGRPPLAAATRNWPTGSRTTGTDGKLDAAATAELLATLRDGSDDDACEQVVELLNRGVAPQSIWDALFDGAGELLMRQPGIVALHAVTTTNALHYAYQASGDDETRRLLLLQNAAFLPMFREAMGGRGKVGDARIDQLEPAATSEGDPGAVDEIFADASRDRMTAARKALAYLQAGATRGPLIDAAGGWCSSRATTPTTTSSARPCWRTTTTSRPPGATATWPRACSSCPARRTGTTTWSSGPGRRCRRSRGRRTRSLSCPGEGPPRATAPGANVLPGPAEREVRDSAAGAGRHAPARGRLPGPTAHGLAGITRGSSGSARACPRVGVVDHAPSRRRHGDGSLGPRPQRARAHRISPPTPGQGDRLPWPNSMDV